MESIKDFVVLFNALALVIAAFWALRKWQVREEHFPRIALEIQARFIEVDLQQPWVLEIVATIENKGLVPIKIRSFEFSLRTLKKSDEWIWGKEALRGQLDFGAKVLRAKLVPESMGYTFVSPGIRTEYTYVTALDSDVQLIRINADFLYPTRNETHHAARVFAVPRRTIGSGAATTNSIATAPPPSRG